MQLNKAGKNQNRLLMVIAGSIVICLLAWNGAFKKTINTYYEVRLLQDSKNLITQNSIMKQQLTNEIGQLNSVLAIGKNKINTESVFEELVTLCESIGNIQILNFPDIHQVETNGYKVTTVFVTVEGNFHELLTLVYKLERDKNIGRLASANFKKTKEIKTGEEHLNLTILIQNYELVNNQKN